MEYVIYKCKGYEPLGGEWYDFSELPQEHSYMKFVVINRGTKRKAINNARKIIGSAPQIINHEKAAKNG